MTGADPERVERIRQEVGEAVAGVLSRHGEFVQRWTILVDSVGVEDNERGLWLASSPGTMVWDRLGMLMFALQLEQAGALRDEPPGA
jgi:hypothetical protein